MNRTTLYRAALRTGAMMLIVGSLTAIPATSATADGSLVVKSHVDPPEVLIQNSSDPQTYRFPVMVPGGGTLSPVPSESHSAGLTQEVLVRDATGAVVGAYDGAWAQDADGNPVPTSFQIDGTTLVQTVEIGPATSFPVIINPEYSPVMRETGGMMSIDFVGVPSNYVYNPALGARHDYCTSSPDEFPNPVGSNANFRGPCARHDMCYDNSSISKFTCDNRLLADMYENCEHEYSWYNPVRYTCFDTADVYWAIVVIA